jgi:hypothetical protein
MQVIIKTQYCIFNINNKKVKEFLKRIYAEVKSYNNRFITFIISVMVILITSIVTMGK